MRGKRGGVGEGAERERRSDVRRTADCQVLVGHEGIGICGVREEVRPRVERRRSSSLSQSRLQITVLLGFIPFARECTMRFQPKAPLVRADLTKDNEDRTKSGFSFLPSQGVRSGPHPVPIRSPMKGQWDAETVIAQRDTYNMEKR
jgi:hypothetical protein